MKKLLQFYALALLVLLVSSCGNQSDGKGTTTPEKFDMTPVDIVIFHSYAKTQERLFEWHFKIPKSYLVDSNIWKGTKLYADPGYTKGGEFHNVRFNASYPDMVPVRPITNSTLKYRNKLKGTPEYDKLIEKSRRVVTINLKGLKVNNSEKYRQNVLKRFNKKYYKQPTKINGLTTFMEKVPCSNNAIKKVPEKDGCMHEKEIHLISSSVEIDPWLKMKCGYKTHDIKNKYYRCHVHTEFQSMLISYFVNSTDLMDLIEKDRAVKNKLSEYFVTKHEL